MCDSEAIGARLLHNDLLALFLISRLLRSLASAVLWRAHLGRISLKLIK